MKMEVRVRHDVYQLPSFFFQFVRNFFRKSAAQSHQEIIGRFNADWSFQIHLRNLAFFLQQLCRVHGGKMPQGNCHPGVPRVFNVVQQRASFRIHSKASCHRRIHYARSIREHVERNIHQAGQAFDFSHISWINEARQKIDLFFLERSCSFAKILDHGFRHVRKASNMRALVTGSISVKHHFAFRYLRLVNNRRDIIANGLRQTSSMHGDNFRVIHLKDIAD